MIGIPIEGTHLFHSHMSFFFQLFIYLGLDGNPLFKGVPPLRCLETLKAHGILVSKVRSLGILEITCVCVCDRLLGKWLLETHRG